MSTQMQSLNSDSSVDWKDRYQLATKEFGEKAKLWSQKEGGLYKSILRLIFSFTGLDEGLDKQISDMRDSLRKESSNAARGNIIQPVIDDVLAYAQQRSKQAKQIDNSAELFDYLFEKLNLPDKYHKQVKTIRRSLAKQAGDGNSHSHVDQLADLISEAAAATARTGDSHRIELKADDPLIQLLQNLSLPGDLGIEIISLRKRAAGIEEEQERLGLIQDLVQLLSRETPEERDNKGSLLHFREVLPELFEWLSIPETYSAQVEALKTRICELDNDSDLSAVLRDTAIIINDLRSALEVELNNVQGFLATVTTRLEDVEGCFRELESSETEGHSETQKLNDDIQNNVRTIRDGINSGADLKVIEQTIEKRLSFIEQSVGDFLQSTQSRQQLWQEKIGILNARLDSMKKDTVKLHKRIQEEYKKAKTDALTGIANRLAYDEEIKQEFARWQRHASPLCVCVIDIDKFKRVNDSYGHKAGDKVLKSIAGICAAKIRKVDFFARYGGEGFVLLLPETGLHHAKIVADNLRREIEVCKFHYSGEPVLITISCGLAQLRNGDTTETVFERADKALYAAKKNGRNQVVDESQI